MSLLGVEGVTKSFGRNGRRSVQALRGVSISVEEGEAVGLVGESGSGKSTLTRCVMRLETPDIGEVTYDGINVLRAKGADLKRFRREVQMIFQDPYSSLNPRMTVEQLVSEGMLVHRLEKSARARRERVLELLAMVGLDPAASSRYPRFFSGGQRQRVAIPRSLAVRPRLLVCDEPVSALDVSVQAQVMNVLVDMQASLGLSILFIAHNLAVVRYLCRRVAVISAGEIS